MAQLLTAHIGNYPRIGDEKDQQRYRRGFAHFERKDISAHAFRDVEQSVTQEIIGEQLSSGLDEITDGLVTWLDPLSHACEHIKGVQIRGLARYFNNNVYFRRPVFTGRPSVSKPLALQEFLFAKSVSHKPIRVILVGPYTRACLSGSEVKSFEKRSNRFDFFTEALIAEIQHLQKAGAALIQLDEPSFAADAGELKLVKTAYQKIAFKAAGVKLILSLPFFPLAGHWDALQDFPVHGLQLDMTRDAESLFKNMRKNPGSKEVGLGLINAQNTWMDDSDATLSTVREWALLSPASHCYLTPSTGLEFLPRRFAQAKLNLINRIRQKYQSALASSPATVPTHAR